jgi:arsenite methyltransferase
MIALARTNVAKSGVTNAEFLQAPITAIPLKDSTADCIISNCVINLVPSDEKAGVFREVFRVLKPGGRVAISDVLARQQLSKEVAENVALYVGCIAGASQIEEYRAWLEGSGFQSKWDSVTFLLGSLMDDVYRYLDCRYKERSQLVQAARKRQQS